MSRYRAGLLSERPLPAKRTLSQVALAWARNRTFFCQSSESVSWNSRRVAATPLFGDCYYALETLRQSSHRPPDHFLFQLQPHQVSVGERLTKV